MRAVHNRFEALLQATPDAVLVQVDRRVAYANAAAYQLFGATRSATGEGSLLGSLLWDRLHPDSHDAVRARLPLVAGGQGEAPPVEEKWVRLDGSSYLAEVSARGVMFDDRPATLVVLHDLTHRRAMQDQIRQQVQDLSLLQEASRAFLFGLAPREIPEYLCALIVERLSFD